MSDTELDHIIEDSDIKLDHQDTEDSSDSEDSDDNDIHHEMDEEDDDEMEELANDMPEELKDLISDVITGNNIHLEEDAPPVQKKLSELTLEGIANYIKKESPKICFMVGAGISTSAGIPDFRTPGTGLYDNLGKYKLDDPQDIFDLSCFDEDPRPFYTLAKELFPAGAKPTTCHYFIKLVDEKGLLKRCFTQNIDSLETIANIPSSKVVFAHGNHLTSSCRICKRKYDNAWLQERLSDTNPDNIVPLCEGKGCVGVVKPDIVFFGENLPTNFFLGAIHDIPTCDLLIIMGTSLVVHPFASIIHEVKPHVPRLLINMTAVGKKKSPYSPSLMYDEPDNIRDVFWPGTCDDGAMELARLLGWETELKELIDKEHARLEELENKSRIGKATSNVHHCSMDGDSVAGPSKQ
uniref:NAD-dependent protein deacetylase n=1 Tax=Parastrongyloides trichosuri TaxID=131310 RepID=A0A0N4ZDP0_PARTI